MGRRELDIEGESKGIGRAIGGCRGATEGHKVLTRRLPCFGTVNEQERIDPSASFTIDHRYPLFPQRFPLFLARNSHSISHRLASHDSASHRRAQLDEECDRRDANANGRLDEDSTSPDIPTRSSRILEWSHRNRWRRRNASTRIQDSKIRFRLE